MKKHELKELAAAAQRQAARWEAMYEKAQEKNEELQQINSELNAQLREARQKLSQYGVDAITFTDLPVNYTEYHGLYNIKPTYAMLREDDDPDPMERLTND